MFCTTKTTRKAIREKYNALVPESLTNQFPNWRSKIEAIKHHTEKKQARTELFPAGNAFSFFNLLCCSAFRYTIIYHFTLTPEYFTCQDKSLKPIQLKCRVHCRLNILYQAFYILIMWYPLSYSVRTDTYATNTVGRKLQCWSCIKKKSKTM